MTIADLARAHTLTAGACWAVLPERWEIADTRGRPPTTKSRSRSRETIYAAWVITDVGFLFSVAAVSMSLASLAGLVIAFRRTGVWAAYDLFRLREIVEWGFANVLLALLALPLASLLGSESAALRALGIVAFVYIISNLLVLARRAGRIGRPVSITAYIPVIVAIDFALMGLVAATVVLATMTPWQLLLVLLVARPMLAFLLVLATLGPDAGPQT